LIPGGLEGQMYARHRLCKIGRGVSSTLGVWLQRFLVSIHTRTHTFTHTHTHTYIGTCVRVNILANIIEALGLDLPIESALQKAECFRPSSLVDSERPFWWNPLGAAKSGRDHPSKNGHVRRRFGLALKRSPPRAPILPGYQATGTFAFPGPLKTLGKSVHPTCCHSFVRPNFLERGVGNTFSFFFGGKRESRFFISRGLAAPLINVFSPWDSLPNTQ